MFPSQNSTRSSPCQKPFHKLRIIFCFPDGSPQSQMHFSPFLHLYLDSLTHPALQLLCLCWGLWGSGGSGGERGGLGQACSGESRPLVWGHTKTHLPLCVSAVPQGQKDTMCSDTHSGAPFTHPPVPNNQSATWER